MYSSGPKKFPVPFQNYERNTLDSNKDTAPDLNCHFALLFFGSYPFCASPLFCKKKPLYHHQNICSHMCLHKGTATERKSSVITETLRNCVRALP